MRGYFTSYAGALYQVLDYEPVVKQLIQPMTTSLEVSGYEDRHEYSAKIAIDEPPASNPSNAEMVTSMIEKIAEEKIDTVEKLVPVYRMYVDYTLYDTLTDQNVDVGTMVRDVTPTHGIIPLGLTDENELVSRFGMYFRARFEKMYQAKYPYGVQRKSKPKYIFAITRVVVMQLKASAFSVVPVKPKGPGFKDGFVPLHIPQRPGMGRPKPPEDGRYPHPGMCHPEFHHHPAPGPKGEYGYHSPGFMGHPTIMEAPVVWAKDNAVVIFDSEWEGISFNQIQISDDVRVITTEIYMNLSNIFITADPSDILSHVDENAAAKLPGGGGIDDDPPIVAPGGDVTEPPINPPKTDGEDTKEPENPGGNTGNNEGTGGTGTGETPEGDKKEEGSEPTTTTGENTGDGSEGTE